MPSQLPPLGHVAARHSLLPAGTVLWRVHLDVWKAQEFNTNLANSYFGGFRFDGTAEDPYSFLYLGATEEVALTEILARNTPVDADGDRNLTYAEVSGRRLSALETTQELRLVSLFSSRDLAAIGQDDWLVRAGQNEFAHTRYWARWLRSISSAQGLVWQASRDRPSAAYVLFGDRCDSDIVVPIASHCLDLSTPAGLEWLADRLRPYRIKVPSPPAGP